MSSSVDIINYIYSDNSFNGYGQLWGVYGNSPSRFLLGFNPGEVPAFDLRRYDTYISKNLMQRPDKRGAGEVFAFNSIVVDCDMHNGDGYSFTDQQREVAGDRLRDLVAGCDYVPSLFVKTGRGCQLWYLIKPAHKKVWKYYDKAQDYIFDYIQDIIEKEDLPFTLDKSVRDAARLVRFPGSYNSKSGTWGSYEIMCRDRYVIQDILNDFGYRKEKKAAPQKTYKNAGDYAGFYWKQKHFLEWLVESRGNVEGYRNIILYLYSTAVWSLWDEESAADAIQKLGEKMGYPETDAVIRFYMSHGVKKHCSKSYFFNILGLTPAEIAYYEELGQKEAQREAQREKKKDRNEQVHKYRMQGFSIRMIAEALKISKTTVQKILHDAGSAAAVILDKIRETHNGLRQAVQIFKLLSEYEKGEEVSIDPGELSVPLMDILNMILGRGSPPGLAVVGSS